MLLELGFSRSKADFSLYSREEEDESMTYLLLYVDDMLVASKYANTIDSICKSLNLCFETKDLGNASCYLGIQLEREENGTILLHQKNKIEDILSTYNMKDAKPAATPMETSYLSNGEEESNPLLDNTLFRQAIGSLLYIVSVQARYCSSTRYSMSTCEST